MEPSDSGTPKKVPAWNTGQVLKWAFVLLLVIAAGVIGFFTIFRAHPAQSTVAKAFDAVQKGDIEGFMEYVDPEGEFGVMWNENVKGVRDAIEAFMDRYLLEFSSLSFATRAEGDAAEVELKGGRVTVYNNDDEGFLEAFFDLEGSNLVFYLEKRGNAWLIEGVNYDITEILSGDSGFLPF